VTEALLEVEGLQVEVSASDRDATRVVDGVSFGLAPGSSLALVGESGSGKTMTLRAIADLLPRGAEVTGGRVAFGGRDLRTLGERELRATLGREIGVIFQEPMTALNPVMRVGEQIAEGPRVHDGLDRAAARALAVEMLTLVGVPDPARRALAYPHELSGGLRQRVMIAVALASRPRLLLCDEPTTALDTTVQDQILRLLRRLQDETGVAIVFVTHDLALVAENFERLAVMYAGRIVETGTVAELLAEPRHPYTLGLIRAVPGSGVPGTRLGAIPGTAPDLLDPPPGCRFHPRCSIATSECAQIVPPLEPLSGDHATACIRHEVCAELLGERVT
jgi:oligopeptide/dipeptide ABC transporter ATP-binding protein